MLVFQAGDKACPLECIPWDDFLPSVISWAKPLLSLTLVPHGEEAAMFMTPSLEFTLLHE